MASVCLSVCHVHLCLLPCDYNTKTFWLRNKLMSCETGLFKLKCISVGQTWVFKNFELWMSPWINSARLGPFDWVNFWALFVPADGPCTRLLPATRRSICYILLLNYWHVFRFVLAELTYHVCYHCFKCPLLGVCVCVWLTSFVTCYQHCMYSLSTVVSGNKGLGSSRIDCNAGIYAH